MVLLRCVETRRLKELSLSPEQAWQSRLLLGQAIAINDVLEPWFSELFTMSINLAKIGLASMIPLIFVVQLPLLWLFLIIVNLLRGRAEPYRHHDHRWHRHDDWRRHPHANGPRCNAHNDGKRTDELR